MYRLKVSNFYYVFFIVYLILQLLLLCFLKIFDRNESLNTSKILNLYNTFLLELTKNSFPDKTNLYRIVWLQSSETNISAFDITLISQCSFNHIQIIQDLYVAWQGPMSVAVFVEVKDIKTSLWELTRLFYCKEIKNLELQVVIPNEDFNIEFQDKIELIDENIDESVFCKSNYFIKKRNYNNTNPYPINLLRNVAKSKTYTDYVMIIDIDLIPSFNLRTNFLNYIKSNNQSSKATAYIVPVFEVDTGVTPPTTKENLIEQIKLKKVRPFYVVPCRNCQRYTGYNKWLMTNSSLGIRVLYEVNWKHPWEPFYVAKKNIPDFDERFKQYGMNRVSQICELYVAGYKFLVLDNAFLVHKGFKNINDFHNTKNIEMEANRKLYEDFKKNLKFKYTKSKRTC